jgi:hypothetical protein
MSRLDTAAVVLTSIVNGQHQMAVAQARAEPRGIADR